MLDSNTLRNIIKEIFNLDDSYIIPITTNWFIPDVDFSNDNAIYIGYRIISSHKVSAENEYNKTNKSYIRTTFRLTFVGNNAEKYASQIHFWDDMKDIRKIFEKYKVQIDYDDIHSFSYPVKNQKFEMSWIFDMVAKTDYQEDLKLVKDERKLLSGNKKKSLLPFKKK